MRRLRRGQATVSLFLLLAMAPAAMAAESPGGVIHGKVVDQATGEPLRKVLVILRGSELQTVTDDEGLYRLEGVPAGNYTLYVSTIGYRLLKKDITLVDGDSQEVLFNLGQEATTISETVRVTAPVFEEMERAAVSQITLNATEIKNLGSVLIDDPLRSVQSLPGVAAGDDFLSAYSVRGGNFLNNGIMIDGVVAHNPAHTVQGTQEPTGSVAILNGELVESMVLYTGAFSARYGDRTASFLEVVTREGSRDRTRARTSVSGTHAAFVVEGPLGRSKRGSWVASARKTYADYLIRRIGPEDNIAMGFTDAQGKLVYDLTPTHRIGTTFVWGRGKLSRDPLVRGPSSLIKGLNNVGTANAYWTWIAGSKVVWENRVYGIRETFDNRNKFAELMDDGLYTEGALRSDLSIQLGGRHRIEAGLLHRKIRTEILDRRYSSALKQFRDYDSVNEDHGHTSLYAQNRWVILDRRLSTHFGVRIEKTGLTGQTIVDPRASIELRLAAGSRIDAGWGVYSQFPEALPVLGRNGNRSLRAETARHYVLGYEQMLGLRGRLRLEVYEKRESNLWRSRDNLFRLVNGKVTAPNANFIFDNALRGRIRGFDLFVQRRSANRLAGWVSYSYMHSRRTDLVTGEVYPGEYDQTHTINVYGSYRFSESWNMSVKSRHGSGFPYPGYFEKRGSDFFLTTVRNAERLPYYSRIDLRLNKAFYFTRSKLSLYFEVVNVLHRKNKRFEQIYSVNAATRRISFGQDSLIPILPTAGFVLEF